MHAAPVDGRNSAPDDGDVSAGLPALGGLQHRRDFLAAAKARKAVTDSFIVQNRARRDDSDIIRVGFTASKKVGNAVARNRAKRRMRALVRDVLAAHGEPGHDYVLVARKDATTVRPFDVMRKDLLRAIERTASSVKR